ncbi:muconolactone Delta-isomerase family protein, partial [Streptomyces katsurahamanus]
GVREELISRERSYCQELQKSGVWPHIWRCAGQYSNLSVFDVPDNDELHRVLWNLPLFPYMTVSVTPLAAHPSALTAR